MVGNEKFVTIYWTLPIVLQEILGFQVFETDGAWNTLYLPLEKEIENILIKFSFVNFIFG